MKVLGKTGSGYIAQIEHSELERFLNLYYGKLNPLKVGDEMDLGRGYEFDADVRCALRKTQEFIEAHQPVINALMDGLKVLSAQGNEK